MNGLVTSAEATSIDDFMDSFITDINKPLSREDEFYNHMCGGKLPKIVNLTYYLRLQFSLYDRLTEYGLCVADMRGPAAKRLPPRQYAKILCEHYLMQHYHHWFVAGALHQTAADMETVITRLLDRDDIKKEIGTQNRA